MTVLHLNEKIHFMKYVSLIALTCQNACVALSLRYGRTRAEKKDLFYSSTAVIMSELIKFTVCLVLVFFEEQRSIKRLATALHKTIIDNKIDTLKVCVPSLLYVIQNNLAYLAVSHLDAATYQVSLQFIIISTAIFSVIILRKRLLLTQWGALYFLIAGISIIQLTDQKKITMVNTMEQNRLIGIGAALCVCILSGFTSVYFEKMLKVAEISIWMRNVQMSLLSIPLGIVTCLISDFQNITTNGFFHGYDSFVIYIVLLQACGGLLSGLVMRYADNILKGFATSLSIIISCIASVYLFDFDLTAQFAIGVMIVIGSIYLYGHVPTLLESNQFDKTIEQKVIDKSPDISIQNEFNERNTVCIIKV